jgi:mannose-6-phosphate isomerase-like protein (cupin superfamily)
MIEKNDEYEKGLSLCVNKKDSGKISMRIRSIVQEWGIGLPSSEPLVLDFGMGDFYTTGESEFWIANEIEAGYCGKLLFLFKGQRCPNHYHDEKLETFFIIKGGIEMDYGGDKIIMKNGSSLRVDQGTYHTFKAMEDSLILEISKPSIIGDNYFEDSRVPFGKNYKR